MKIDIVLEDFPLCPSVNECKALVRGRFINTAKLRDFYAATDAWKRRHIIDLQPYIDYLRENEKTLRVDAYHCFRHSRVWTKKDVPKTLDADNRMKACLDGVAKVMEFNDRCIFAGMSEKVTVAEDELESTIIHIYEHKPRTRAKVLTRLDLEAESPRG